MTPRPVSPRPAVERPAEIRYAWWLWIASAAAGLIRTVIVLSDRDALVSMIRRSAPEFGQTQIDQAVNRGVFAGLAFATCLFLFYALLARTMAHGHNQARIVLYVLAAVIIPIGLLGVVNVVAGVSPDTSLGIRLTPPMIGLMVVDLGCLLAATVLMSRPRANAYFRSMTTARQTAAHGQPIKPGSGSDV